MIIAKSPLRISIAGGGTDIPEFYSKHNSRFISAAINKYSRVFLNSRTEEDIRISYSKLEYANSAAEVEHPIIRETLKHFNINGCIDIISAADFPKESGLGSSGAFGVALTKALSVWTGHDEDVPELAYKIEREKLGRHIGKQDQYVSYNGGLNIYNIDKSGNVDIEKINGTSFLESHLALFYTGLTRNSELVLKHLPNSMPQLELIQDLETRAEEAIDNKDVYRLGKIFDTHWSYKKSIAPEMSQSFIDICYRSALENGAIGGKIIGAGGGGCLIFVYDTQEDYVKLHLAMTMKGLDEVKYKINTTGTECTTW